MFSSSEEALKGLGEGMLCMVRKQVEQLHRSRKRQKFGLTPESTTVELKEVNQLNAWLLEVEPRGAGDPPYYATAEEVLDEWKLLGVIKSEVAPRRNYGEPAASRVLNLIVHGRVPTFNLWGGHVTAGADLYLLVTRRKRGSAGQVAWTVTPWSSRNGGRPGPAELRNHSDVPPGTPGPQKVTYGDWVYVGKAGESILDGTPVSQPIFEDTLKGKKLQRYLQLQMRV